MKERDSLENVMHHLAVVTNKSRAEVIRFYNEVMGLPMVDEKMNRSDDLLYFELAINLQLEVLLTEDELNDCKAPANKNAGFAHFSFTVDDVYKWHDMVKDAGLEVVYKLREIPELNIVTFLFRDPFDAVWEVMQDL